MAAVVFALASRPGLAAHEAEDIANKLAGKAETEPGRDIELDQDELRQLAAVLESMRSVTDFRAALGRLHADVATALGH